MAIKRFPNGSTDPHGVQPLATWLENAKDGTFLEDATFEVTDLYVSGGYNINELAISIGQDDARIRASKTAFSGSISFDIALLTPYDSNCALLYSHSQNSIGISTIAGAWLCKNGLIISTFTTGGGATASENDTRTTVLLTTDPDGNLVLAYTDPQPGQVRNASAIPPEQFYIATRSNTKLLYKAEPWVPASRFYTNIHSASVINPSGEPVTLGNLFVSSVAQTPTTDYSTVYYTTLNGVAYMTNGIWYLKDE